MLFQFCPLSLSHMAKTPAVYIHQKPIKNKSAIAEHLLESGPNHWIELHAPKVLSSDRQFYPRVVREAIEIKKFKNFNREDGYKLSSWNPVISRCSRRGLCSRVTADTVSIVCRDSESIFLQDEMRVVGDNTRLTQS